MKKSIIATGVVAILAVGAIGGTALNSKADNDINVVKLDDNNISVVLPTTPATVNIDALKRKLTTLQKQKADLITQHQKNLDALDKKIAETQQIITQAASLGVE